MIGMMFEKVAMTSVFDKDEKMVPVTVLQLLENRVIGLTSVEKQGYSALRIAYGINPKEKRKPIKGLYKERVPARGIVEFRLDDAERRELGSLKVGSKISLSTLEGLAYVDARARSIGRGYQGVIKRHGMSGGPSGHGSHFHRRPGSIGMCADPARVFKGKKMAGQMGDVHVCVQNLKLFSLDIEAGILLVVGSVPGHSGSLVKITPSIKKRLSLKVAFEGDEMETLPEKPAEVVAEARVAGGAVE